MSIEQKIAEILAESKLAGAEGGSKTTTENASAGDQSVIRTGNPVPNGGETPNPDNARNNVDDEDEAANATSKKPNVATAKAAAGDQSVIRTGTSVKEDVDALLNGEDLSEEFKQKAETIFEAAVMNRVKAEVARLEEEFEAKLQESVAQNVEGLVEQVDGYLGYVAEQWIAQNEIALERGMKSEILEGFVNGLKGLFEEHYIDVPEERFDVLGEMEQRMEELEAKLNEQVAANIELSKTLAEAKRGEIVKTVSEGLTDTETEKFLGLVEELSYENAETFETKVKTIRENYFTTKAITEVKSVVTDAPVEALTEGKKLDPVMSAYLSALNK
jgi:uncharacterized coiled-coil protein SlyX